MVHLSGSGTVNRPPPPQKQVPTVQKKVGVSQSSGTYRKKRMRGGKSRKGGSGTIYSVRISGGKSSRATRRSGDIEDLLDGDEAPKLSVTVVGIDGSLFNASSISSGVDNMLRLESGGNKRNLHLSDVTFIKFGKKDLNRLSVVVRMESGEKVKGYLYPRYIFEFKSGGSVTTALADQLSYVNIQAE